MAIQIGGVLLHKLLSAKRRAILLQKHRDRNGRCIAILFKRIGVRGRFDSPGGGGFHAISHIAPSQALTENIGADDRCWNCLAPQMELVQYDGIDVEVG